MYDVKLPINHKQYSEFSEDSHAGHRHIPFTVTKRSCYIKYQLILNERELLANKVDFLSAKQLPIQEEIQIQ